MKAESRQIPQKLATRLKFASCQNVLVAHSKCAGGTFKMCYSTSRSITRCAQNEFCPTSCMSVAVSNFGAEWLGGNALCKALMGCYRYFYLGKVSPTFPAALFSVDARFARNIERPQTGIKWPVTTKQTQANERTSSEQNIQSKKTCKYVVASSYELFKSSMFLKISDNSTTN